ncbi:hypothetical protein EYZ11_004483 [Aspergillus tanneri]|uniref:AB hydrolase-1 domain-containing protein n=1 Tax=Aspergillus tanneri TaxID=1220188 RepID=A0A4S3JKP1_9EURO|nr:uncharacterized protein ATNIH1004_009179 [Aspergillus tanneri]KAA8644968.1 hypothetical protein ATNIH1004_009179 [Aspergillus tanneri]THC96023.1 hypothetical protein EYZ11_004483 [Aspergillus tanneri]
MWSKNILTGLIALASVTSPLASSAEITYHREYLYVGGQYVQNADGDHLFSDQMYVEKLTPSGGVSKPHPVVFIHGQAQTGTNWLNKPDGGRGWASYFLEQGYECYLLDQTFRGRSPRLPDNGIMKTYSAENLQQLFTAPKRYMQWPQAALHTQWPGAGVMGDRIFDTYYASTVDFFGSAVGQQTSVQRAGAALLDLIGKKVILFSHSQGGIMPWILTDVRPHLVHAIMSLEPSGPPFSGVSVNRTALAYGLSDIPITYSPPVSNPETDFVLKTLPSDSPDNRTCVLQADDPAPRKLTNLQKVPVAVLTTESSYHAPYDWCTVRFLQQAGVNVEHLELGELGIHGNGHMVFLEKNSDEVAGLIQRWIEKH